MAGKPKLSAGKSGDGRNWGGRRPNQTGRPKKPLPDYDEKFKKEFERIATRLKRKYKKSVIEAVMELAYDPDADEKAKIGILKLYAEIYTVKKSEQKVEVTKTEAPAIGLPPKRQDPALRIVASGGA